MRIRDLMVRSLVVARPDETMGEVRERLESLDIGAVPVVDAAGQLLGIVTAEDLLRSYEPTLPVSRLMSAPVVALDPEATPSEAARTMRRDGIHHLPVIERGRLVGMLSSLDLLALVDV